MNINEFLGKLKPMRIPVSEASNYTVYMDPEEREKYFEAIGDGKSFVNYKKSQIEQWRLKREKYDEENRRLAATAELNNKGIALEKAGSVNEAIDIYERNIDIGYIASHSYTRLMVIYRRLKRYKDEIRVIETAIEKFSAANRLTFEFVSSDPKNSKYRKQLKECFDSNQKFINDEGWYIFNPYPTDKWKQRLEKAKHLLSKDFNAP